MNDLDDVLKLSITDFRSIAGTVVVPLDTPIILIHGPNGTGKTSVLSALELALTGTVRAMKDDDPNFARHVVHEGAKEAKVAIIARDGNESERGTYLIKDGTIAGTPYLEESDRKFFGERCYLAQSMLGRLLDIYQNSKVETGESALTQFVKDLLGLNQLDALIDGLHAAGHKTRTKNLVPEYGAFEARIEGQSLEIRRLESELSQLDTNRAETAAGLSQTLSLLFPSEPAGAADLKALAGRLALLSNETALIDATRRLTEIRSLANAWARLPEDADTAARGDVEAREAEARKSADEWRASVGAELETLTIALRATFPDLASWSSTDPASVVDEANRRVGLELARLDALLEKDSAAEKREAEIVDAIAKEETRGALVDTQMVGLARDAGQFAGALATLLPHIHSEDCPVCGRDYSQVSPTEPLSVHVQKVIAKFTEDAGKLAQLSTEKSASAGRLAQMRRDLTTLRAQRLAVETRQESMRAQADMREHKVALDRLSTAARSGGAILTNEARLRASLAAFRERDRLASELLDTARRYASELTLGDMANERFELVVSASTAMMESEVAKLTSMQSQRTTANRAVETLSSIDDRRKIVADQAAKARQTLSVLKAAVSELEKLKAQAKIIADAAQDSRTAIVRRVFNDSLNTLWRDLFIRLAPTEPFVPAFKVPESDSKNFAILETVHRNGKKGGTPGAMLSAGNLNTAALTLFLALHFSVGSRLPWLVLDDPVQNMDEVHIAQFAALLRTISRAHGTKIVVAVHERTLFDYLKLELSPSYEKDRLLALELRRGANEPTHIEPDLLTYVVDAVAA